MTGHCIGVQLSGHPVRTALRPRGGTAGAEDLEASHAKSPLRQVDIQGPTDGFAPPSPTHGAFVVLHKSGPSPINLIAPSHFGCGNSRAQLALSPRRSAALSVLGRTHLPTSGQNACCNNLKPCIATVPNPLPGRALENNASGRRCSRRVVTMD